MSCQKDIKQSVTDYKDTFWNVILIHAGKDRPTLALTLSLTWSPRASHLIELVDFILHSSLLSMAALYRNNFLIPGDTEKLYKVLMLHYSQNKSRKFQLWICNINHDYSDPVLESNCPAEFSSSLESLTLEAANQWLFSK